MSVRRASLADVDAIAEAHQRSVEFAYRSILVATDLALITVPATADRVRLRIQDGEAVFVALCDDSVIGWARWGIAESSEWPYKTMVHTVFVDPPWFGKGVGKMLLRACLVEAREAGESGTLIGVFLENQKASQWYQSLGGRVVDESPFEFGANEYAHRVYAFDDLSDVISRLG